MTLQVGQLKKFVGMNTSRRNGQDGGSSVFSELVDGLSLAYGGYRDNAGDTIFADVSFRNSWVRTVPRVLLCASCPHVLTRIHSWQRTSAHVLCVFVSVMCYVLSCVYSSVGTSPPVPSCLLYPYVLLCAVMSVFMGTNTT